MKLYTCSHCKNQLYFENNICLVCHHTVGFDPISLSMLTLVDKGNAGLADIKKKRNLYRWCSNAAHGTCNWLIPADDPSFFCTACRLNRTIPELSDDQNLARWKRIEIAKHRLVYSLLRLHLPIAPQIPAPAAPDPQTPTAPPQPAPTPHEIPGIAFDFMANISPDERVMTGHNNGVITLNIEEADEAERARNKEDLGEKYRTLLGHFRHEIGHYYWDVLIKDNPKALQEFRRLFGDEQKDYGEALAAYYAAGAAPDWADHFISPYAGAHPWEDWAETWSHYMHMMDTLETAWAFGIGIHPGIKNIVADIKRDPYELADFNAILNIWLPLTFAVNSLNRSMGHPDFYPFVISPAIVDKLRFIHLTARRDKLIL